MPLQNISIEDYREQFTDESTYQLIDVREVEEFEEIRLPNTVNIPLSEFQGRVDEVATDKPVVLVCRSGARSHMVGEFLVANGLNDLYNLLEGTIGWVRRDLPTETG